MKTPRNPLLAAAASLALGLLTAHAADPVVSNVTAVQRPGTKLVDITYDVIADTATVNVRLEISVDGGTTFSVPVTSANGHVGDAVEPGAQRKITWNAGADWDGQSTTKARYRVSAAPPEFSWIPAGSFTMGDTLDGDIEAPPVQVTLSAFYMAKHEVTWKLWREVRDWARTSGKGYVDLPDGLGKADDHPVHSIDWFAMIKWCNARSEMEGLVPCYTAAGLVMRTGTAAPQCNWFANGYRLPTEAEWEKAARGGVAGKRFPWGTDTITHDHANYISDYAFAYDMSATRGYHPTYAIGDISYTSPVSSFAANGYGLYGVSGNVWERCWDWYGFTYVEGMNDPRGATSGSSRVVRGGSWGDGRAYYCRAAYRGYFPTNNSTLSFH